MSTSPSASTPSPSTRVSVLARAPTVGATQSTETSAPTQKRKQVEIETEGQQQKRPKHKQQQQETPQQGPKQKRKHKRHSRKIAIPYPRNTTPTNSASPQLSPVVEEPSASIERHGTQEPSEEEQGWSDYPAHQPEAPIRSLSPSTQESSNGGEGNEGSLIAARSSAPPESPELPPSDEIDPEDYRLHLWYLQSVWYKPETVLKFTTNPSAAWVAQAKIEHSALSTLIYYRHALEVAQFDYLDMQNSLALMDVWVEDRNTPATT
ncbi:hypothetical protein BGZ99_000738, partial [Dissophora globulifera]